ncbi:SMI1/KNR4 family protein [Promicromonospora umidemergens]|uniref:SMI1/KNR4 family protein n=1 Tax=Promicromonospora umidemergens TaxID=629679 RepID=UPI0020A2B319|nr:SMI1/KNR4 family protein [Promicromonospora umidemergens]
MSLTEWQTWEPFVDALRRSAPPTTEVSEFVGTIGRGAWQGSYLDDGDADVRRDHYRKLAREAARSGDRGPKADLDDALRAIAELTPGAEQLVRVSAGARVDDDVVELVVLPPAVVSGPAAPVLEVVLQPGALPAQYLRPIAPVPGAAPASSADPDTVTRVVTDRMPDAVGAAPEAIAAAEAGLPGGVDLPEEVRALYAAAGAGSLRLDPQDGSSGGFEIVPLSDSLLREAFLPAARFDTWTTDAGTFAPEDPAGRVQAAIGSPLWFPVGSDGAGNVYAVDLAPGVHGHVGQVVLLDHEMRAGAVYRAESLAALLVGRRTGLDKLDRRGGVDRRGGERERQDEFLNLDPAEWVERLDAGTVPGTLKAAGLVPDRTHPPALTDAISAANRLLDLRGLAPIEVTRLTRPEHKSLFGRLFDR